MGGWVGGVGDGEELSLLCKSSKVLGQSSEEVWNWSSPSELYLTQTRGLDLCSNPHCPVIGCRLPLERECNLDLQPGTIYWPSCELTLSAVNSRDSLDSECLVPWCVMYRVRVEVALVGDDSCQYTTVSTKIHLCTAWVNLLNIINLLHLGPAPLGF